MVRRIKKKGMEKKKRVTLGPRADESVKAFFTKLFGSANGGAEYVVQSWPTLYKRTMADVLPMLSIAERTAIIDSSNGTTLTPSFAGSVAINHMQDGIGLDGLDKTYHFDGQALTQKMMDMKPFELACIEVWARGYWEQFGEEGEVSIDEYLNPRSLV